MSKFQKSLLPQFKRKRGAGERHPWHKRGGKSVLDKWTPSNGEKNIHTIMSDKILWVYEIGNKNLNRVFKFPKIYKEISKWQHNHLSKNLLMLWNLHSFKLIYISRSVPLARKMKMCKEIQKQPFCLLD